MTYEEYEKELERRIERTLRGACWRLVRLSLAIVFLVLMLLAVLASVVAFAVKHIGG